MLILIPISLMLVGSFSIAQAIKIAKQRKETKTDFNFFFLTGKKEYWFYLVSGATWMTFAFVLVLFESPRWVTKAELNLTKDSAFIILISVLFWVAYQGLKRGKKIWKKVSREVDETMK